MKKYVTVVSIIGLLALAATLNRAAWAETAQGKTAAIAQLGGLPASAELNKADAVPAPEGTDAAAGEPLVKITSFVMTDQTSPLAEICGRVTGSDAEFTAVRILVDPKSNNPGAYTTLAGKDGAFCSVVVTYTRTASASVKVLGKDSSSAVATASEAVTR